MEELTALRQHIQKKDYSAALRLVDELEEMSKEDKLNKIYSYVVILLIHLIKQQAESRSTTSWDLSIRNAVRAIKRVNKRRKSGGYYANQEDLKEIIREALEEAIDTACVEIFEGKYDRDYLDGIVDTEKITTEAFELITEKSS
ncbi:MAG: DUF29 family protein [Bacteroidota bacterium]